MRAMIAEGLTTLVAVLTLAACAGGAGGVTAPETAASTGLLLGRATHWGGPVEGAGTPGSPGAAGVRVVVAGLDGRAAGSTTTDARGGYRIALPAGTYQITVKDLRPGEFVKELPATVTVRPGVQTRFDILVDTGVR